MATTVELIVVDIGRTLGEFTGVSTTARLKELSPMTAVAPARVGEEVRALLHRAPEVTPELVSQVCERLLIPIGQFPTEWERGYVAYASADQALGELGEIAPVVALSNMSVTGGAERVAAVMTSHGGLLAEVYTSFGLGGAKPEPWLWHLLAGRRDVETQNVVHIGDRLDADVYGALAAGARVVHICKDGESTLYPPGVRDRVSTAFSVLDAVRIVRAWAER